MKKVLIFLIIFFASVTTVKAAPISTECVDDNTCMVLCNYATTFKTGSYNAGYSNTTRNLTIYYNYAEKNITVRWQATSGGTSSNPKIFQYSKGPNAIDYIFSNSGTNIYWGLNERPSLSDFKCPNYGYLDFSDLNSDNELCFDDDGETCAKKFNNIGTNFKLAGTKDYDIYDQVSYYSENLFEDIKEKINNGTFDLNSDLSKKIQSDFKDVFLNGNDIPEFIANSDEYKDLNKKLVKEFEKAKEAAIKESEKEVEEGKITEEEHEQVVNNWDVSTEVISSQVDLGFKNINMNVTILQDFNVSEYCESYLGNPTITGSPAYYLQFLFNLIKYAAIVILFVLTVVEFAKATASSNQDAMKKAIGVSIKRLIIVIIIFFLPILIKFLLTILGAYSPSTCGIS